jgi:hypothetical protein
MVPRGGRRLNGSSLNLNLPRSQEQPEITIKITIKIKKSPCGAEGVLGEKSGLGECLGHDLWRAYPPLVFQNDIDDLLRIVCNLEQVQVTRTDEL